MYRRKYVVFSVMVLVLLSAVATYVFAQVENSDRIFACVNNRSGTIKIVGSDADCSANAVPLSWNPDGSVGGGGVLLSQGGFFKQTLLDHPDGFCFMAEHTEKQDCASPGAYIPIPSDGQFVSLAIQPVENFRSDDSIFTLMVNGSPTTLTATVPDGSMSVVLASSVVPVSAGDLITMRVEGNVIDPPKPKDSLSYHLSLLYRAD